MSIQPIAKQNGDLYIKCIAICNLSISSRVTSVDRLNYLYFHDLDPVGLSKINTNLLEVWRYNTDC